VSKLIRERLEEQFGSEWILLLGFLGLLRAAIQSKKLGSQENQSLFRKIARLPLLDWIDENQREQSVKAIYEICDPWLSMEEINHLWDEAWKNFSFLSPHCATDSQP